MRHLLLYIFIFGGIGIADLCGQAEFFRRAVFHNITADDGLAHRTVNSIEQDRDGFIWIGTNNGLNRYGGKGMQVYRWDITEEFSLPDNRVLKLLESRSNRLWVISGNGTLSWFDPARDQFHTPHLTDSTIQAGFSVRDMAADAGGGLWILAGNQSVYRLDTVQAYSRSIRLAPELLELPDGATLERIVVDGQNRLWVATAGSGVFLFDIHGESPRTIRRFTRFKKLRMLDLDDQNNLWFAKNNRIFRASLSNASPKIEPFYDLGQDIPDDAGSVTSICADEQGQVWVAVYGFGLLQLRAEAGRMHVLPYPGNFKGENGLTNDHLSVLMVDKYNVLWAGSQNGIFWSHVNQKPFFQVSKQKGKKATLIDNIVGAVYRDRYLWVGTRNGLSVIDTLDNTYYNYPVLFPGKAPKDNGGISAIVKDRRGRVWIGTSLGGLYLVFNSDDPARLIFHPVHRDRSPLTNFSRINIRDLELDEYGRLWVGTSYDGAYILVDDERGNEVFFEFRKIPGLPVGTLSNLYPDPFESTMWIGTWENGLIRVRMPAPDSFDQHFFKNLPGHANSLSINHVNPIVRTDESTLWVGTIGGGLNKISFINEDSVQYRHFYKQDGLPGNTIHSMQSDHSGNLWISGTNGLSLFDPEKEVFTNFDKRDGLQGNLFIVGADFKDPAGRLYFGGANGLNFFNPRDIAREESLPNLMLDGLKINNRVLRVDQVANGRVLLLEAVQDLNELSIKEKENDLALNIQVIHTAAPSKNRLRYRLLNLQEEWIDVDNHHASIHYSNLAPGNYTLQVMAGNGDGVWNSKMRELKIKVLPYWYKTKTAYAGYALFLLFLLWLFRRVVIIRNNLRHQLQLARIEKEREHEMAEMKMHFFNNITHELRTPLTLIKGPVEELIGNEGLFTSGVRQHYLHLIHQNAEKLHHLVNSLLDFRKAETDYFQLQSQQGDIRSFAKEIYLSFQQLAREKNVRYIFEARQEPLRLPFDREKLEIVLCNLLSNAFKYSKGRDEVRLRVLRLEDYCLLEVSDTGEGIPPEEINKIFDRFYQIARAESSQLIGTGIGLAMVKSIVELHEGRIEVSSQLGKGSTFRVFLPLTNEEPDACSPNTIEEKGEDVKQYEPLVETVWQEEYLAGEALPGQMMLIVEDNPEVRTFIRSIFASQFIIREAANGLQGLEVLKEELPDIIISDIMMDKMDGITFCERVREDARLVHIPFILLTARTSQVYHVDGLSSGADAYITKPFNGQVLKASVSNLLKSRAVLREYYAQRITLGPKKIELPSEEVIFLEKLIDLIEENMEAGDLSAESLAEAMALSHSTLYRRVKSYTGKSINTFIRSIRLKQAAQLLIDSNLRVSEVAYKVGFSDVNYFGKCFKKQFSMSPTDYVKFRMNS